MKKYQFLFLLLISFALILACNKEEVDDQKPEIDLDISGAFPHNCDTIYFDETFVFKAIFIDNTELGSYSIELHQNFDHHAHSTEVITCDLSPVKTPVNPFHFIKSYTIPDGSSEYMTNLEIEVPNGNDNNDFDEGDYHFFISLTDKEGWSTQKGLNIKLLRRTVN